MTDTKPPVDSEQTVTEQPLLQVRDLTVSFGGGRSLFGKSEPLIAVDSLSLHVNRGETVGLVGESGSGKSTTARAVLRLVEAAEGSIHFDSKDVTAFGKKTPLWYRKSVQAVFQDPASSLNPRHIVSQAVTGTLRRHGVASKAERTDLAREAFERVGLLPAHLDRLPSELSGGQQQRVAIARALALHSDLVICDEAVSALDLSTQAQILNLLGDLQDSSNLSYLFIGHDLGVVKDICDRIVVMYLGRVVEVADKAVLFSHPKHPYTRSLLAATPASHPDQRDKRRARRAAHRSPDDSAPPKRGAIGCPFRNRCSSVMDICHSTNPLLQRLEDGAEVACFLYDDAQSVELVGAGKRWSPDQDEIVRQ